MLLGRTTRIPEVVRNHRDFRLRGGTLSFHYTGGRDIPNGENQLYLYDNEAKVPITPREAHNKLLALKAGYIQIERAMMDLAIIDSDSMGAPFYDIETGNDCRYIPSHFDAVAHAFSYVTVKWPGWEKRENRKLVDLGSGLGLPVFAAKLFGFNPTGIEMNMDLFSAAMELSGKFPDIPELRDVNFLNSSFFEQNLSPYGFAYLYFFDDAITYPRIQEKLADELVPGSILIVHGQTIRQPPEIKFKRIITVDPRTHLYEIKP